MFDFGCIGTITDLIAGEVWSPARMAHEVRHRARVLRRLGIERGGAVVIAQAGTPSFFADLFAVWQVGALAVCVDTRLTVDEFDTVLAFIEPAAVLVDREVPGLDGRAIRSADEPAQPDDDPASPSPATLDDPALILFTSGTTAEPKGVVHSFRSLAARLALNRVHIGDADMARSLCVLPIHFGHGLIGNCLTPLMAGGDLYLMPGTGADGAGRLGGVIADHGITFMSSVPAFWKLVLKLSRPPGASTLRRVHVGSAPLSADLWRAVVGWAGTDQVLNMYGLTETANWFAGASARDMAPEDGLVGKPWGGRAMVRAADGELRLVGEGELLLLSPSCMRGYHERPDATRAALAGGWLRSGDIGRIDQDGTIRLTGRQKNEINWAGFKVHPEEVELLVERHPAVAEACVFGAPHALAGEVVAIAVRLVDGQEVPASALRAWCGSHIRRECVPKRWFVVSEVPKTERGKIDRRTLIAACLREQSQL